MARKRFSAEEIIQKLRESEVHLSQGDTIPEACRKIGLTDQTYYRWRKEYGCVRTDQAKRLKELDRENARLKKLLTEAELEKAILREAVVLWGEALSRSVVRAEFSASLDRHSVGRLMFRKRSLAL